MRFSTPDFFWSFLVIVALAVFFYWTARRRKRLLEAFAERPLLAGLIAGFSPRKRRYKYVLVFLSMIFLVLALARPQFGTHMVMLKREGQDVVVAIDVSASMLAEDMKPSRLAKAKEEVRGIISKMQGDRVGLVAFAGSAFIQCPLTLDYSAASLFLDVIDTDLIPQPGTDIGDAIKMSVSAFNDKERKHNVLIMITDGEDFGGEVDAAIEDAKVQGAKIYTIGIGRPEGEPIPIRNQRGEMIGYKKDEKGELIMTRLDEITLQNIAAETGGRYYHASAGEIALDQIYAEISGMEKKEQEERLMTQYEDRFQYILPFAIVFLAAEILISERKSRRRKNGEQ